MRRVYEVAIEQPDNAGSLVPLVGETYQLEARTIEQAIAKARRLFLAEEAFYKSRPIVVKSASLLLKNLR